MPTHLCLYMYLLIPNYAVMDIHCTNKMMQKRTKHSSTVGEITEEPETSISRLSCELPKCGIV